MFHIVITAGGTIENIDAVRSIANTSTGKLGSLICEAFIQAFEEMNETYHIHYIISQSAIRPDCHPCVTFYDVTNTLSVQKAVKDILEKYHVHGFIHSMAISDFMVSSAVDIKDIVQDICDLGLENPADMTEKVENILRHSKYEHNREQKISSKDDLMLVLEKTPKIIKMVKDLQPKTFLVGFKLLNNVSEAHLVEVATALERKNKCDFVLANDLKYINKGLHKGLIVKNGQVIDRYNGKEAIANGIVRRVMAHLKR